MKIRLSLSEECSLWNVRRSNYYRWKKQGWQQNANSRPRHDASGARKTSEFMVEMIQKQQIGTNRMKKDLRTNKDSLDDQVLKDLCDTYAAYSIYVKEASYYQRLMLCIVAVWVKNPFFGYRRITEYVQDVLEGTTLKQVRTLMRNAGLMAIIPRPNLSAPRKGNHKFPYLLRGLKIDHINQVWSVDVTYLKMPKGMMYLVAVMDIYSRKILSWRLSNTMDVSFCLTCLQEAVEQYGKPEILNSDQGSQFTSNEFVNLVKKKYKILFSMDGVGRAKDNIWTERSWKSLKYEMFFLNDFQTVDELRNAIDDYWVFYNGGRRHQSLNYITPNMKYFSSRENIEIKGQTA